MATIEEASKCSKCGLTGERGAPQASAKPGVKVIVFTCRNKSCVWYDTGWPVQVNPDGSIPDPEDTRHGPKQFDRPSDLMVAQNIEQVEKYVGFFQDKSTER
jgi:hypothetical protein